MKLYHFTFTEIECTAIREALTEYYHTTSKHCLKNPDISPYAVKLHNLIIELKDQFQLPNFGLRE